MMNCIKLCIERFPWQNKIEINIYYNTKITKQKNEINIENIIDFV